LSENEQIRKIRDTGIYTVDLKVKISSIDSLATYGMQGIDPIMDIVGSTITEEVKTHGLDAVKRIREKLK
jgi:hypothetical protein